MTTLLPSCQHPSRKDVRGSACLRSAGSVQWAYCPLCDLFAMEATPEISSQARQQVEVALHSFVRKALERDQAAADARDAQVLS